MHYNYCSHGTQKYNDVTTEPQPVRACHLVVALGWGARECEFRVYKVWDFQVLVLWFVADLCREILPRQVVEFSCLDLGASGFWSCQGSALNPK